MISVVLYIYGKEINLKGDLKMIISGHEEVGNKYINNQGHSGVIIKVEKPDIPNDGDRRRFMGTVLFESGYVCKYKLYYIKKGIFQDCGIPNEVGGYDYPKEKPVSKTIYNRWYKMLSRCNNPEDQDYHNYGGRGVRVCDEWHYLEVFERDFMELDGYDDLLKNPSKYTLDKDFKIKGNMMYCKENCSIINSQKQSENRRNVVAVKCTGKDGGMEIFPSMAEAGRQLGINKALIRRVVNGKATHTHGYYFERIEGV